MLSLGDEGKRSRYPHSPIPHPPIPRYQAPGAASKYYWRTPHHPRSTHSLLISNKTSNRSPLYLRSPGFAPKEAQRHNSEASSSLSPPFLMPRPRTPPFHSLTIQQLHSHHSIIAISQPGMISAVQIDIDDETRRLNDLTYVSNHTPEPACPISRLPQGSSRKSYLFSPTG